MTGLDATLLIAFTAFQVGDGATTIIALRSPALGEGNPLARRLMDRLGIVETVVAFKLAGIALGASIALSAATPWIKTALLLIGCAMFGWATVDNYRLIRKHRP